MANGEHHTEHGEHVDGKAQRIHHGEGSHQRNRNNDGRNDRVPEILKEQIHDDENQENTFKQGFHHFMKWKP